MKISTSIMAALCTGMVFPTAGHAQIVGRQASPAAAAMGQCIVGQTTGNDRMLVARWFGTSISSVPQLAEAVTVDQAEKLAIDKNMAALFVRLLTRDCSEEARSLIDSQDGQGIATAFGLLGEIAMRELMADPEAQEAMMGYIEHIPDDAFEELAGE